VRASRTVASRAAQPRRIDAELARTLVEAVYHVHWSAERMGFPDQPLVLGVLGESSVVAELESAVEGRRIDGHPFEVRSYPTLDEVDGPHALFVSATFGRTMSRIREAVGAGILIVGEGERFARDGGALGLVARSAGRPVVINRAAFEEDGLSVEPELLELATVTGESRPGGVPAR
jgi:hypothetical protein